MDVITRRVYCFICFMITLCICTGQADSDVDADRVSEFLKQISHDWNGTAVQTPVGRVRYNIDLTRISNGHVSGAAELVRATHYWDFYRERDKLYLKFLTTFAGNTEPLFFQSKRYSAEEMEFNSTSRDDVKVIVNLANKAMLISIFLNENSHVKIELTR